MGGGVGVALLILMVLTVSLVVALSSGGSLLAVSPPSTVPPTSIARPTASPTPSAPRPITAATLGGTQDAFTGRYGAAVDDQGQTFVASINGQQAQIFIDLQSGQDGEQHVDVIHVQPPPGSGMTWDPNTAAAITQTFLPQDATPVQDIQSSSGVEHIYRSAALAATFSADMFTNATGTQAVPSGTLFWQCGASSKRSRVPLCIVSIGTR
jgi:hypothetical protein